MYDVVSRQLGVECNTFRISVPETKPEACSEPLKFGWDCGRANDMDAVFRSSAASE